MAKEKQDTIEEYYVTALFPDDRELMTGVIKGKNLTAKEAAKKGAAKLGGFEENEDPLYSAVEKDYGTRGRGGWKRFIIEDAYGVPFQVAVAHKSTKIL